MKLCVVSFGSMTEKECAHIRSRHPVDSRSFSGLPPNWTTEYIRFYNGFTVVNSNPAEKFLKGRKGFFYLPLNFYLYLRKTKPDVLFVHGFVFPVQVLFLRLFKPGKTKIIVQHHSERPFVNPFKLFLQKLVYSKADHYIFAYKEQAEVFLEKEVIKQREKISEVLEGSSFFKKQDKAASRTKLGLPNKTIFLWVGRLNANKDPMTVLKAVDAYKKSGKDFKLYMIFGTSELEAEVGSFIKENDLSGYVELIGNVEHPRLEDWFSAADYFIAASHEESVGIAMCEAMSCGCIPITTNILSFSALTNNGKVGLLFKPSDHKELFEKLISLSGIDQEEMSQRVMEQFNKTSSFDAISKNYLRIFNKILNE